MYGWMDCEVVLPDALVVDSTNNAWLILVESCYFVAFDKWRNANGLQSQNLVARSWSQ